MSDRFEGERPLEHSDDSPVQAVPLAAATLLSREFSTIVAHQAARRHDKTAFIALDSEGHEVSRHTYEELHAAVEVLAPTLAAAGLSGERVLMLYDSGMPFVVAFLACLRAGVIPAPCHIARPGRASWARLVAVARNAAVTAVLTESAAAPRLAASLQDCAVLADKPVLVTDTLTSADPLPLVRRDGGELAFLQYTSGSTGDPKGTMVTLENLRQNARICERSGVGEESRIVCWLPAYHDLGLIGNILQTLYVGATCVLLPPTSVARNPAIWLGAIHRYRATMSAAPNFAYHLAARRLSADQKAGLDLSTWITAPNTSEPIRGETIDRFTQAFALCGFAPGSLRCGYGLAEATLMVTAAEAGQPPKRLRVAATALEQGRLEVAVDGREIVSCGRVFAPQRLVIVDPEHRTPIPDGSVGEIWLAGPCVAAGYWPGGAASDATFKAQLADGEGPFMRTGDLGAMVDGELYVTGRIKEVIVVRGRKLFPQDLEGVASDAHPALRPGGGAAFAVHDDSGESIVLVQEVERSALARLDVAEVTAAVREAVLEAFDVGLRDVVLVKPETTPKTSSGKIQRVQARTAYLAGECEALRLTGARRREPA